MGAGNVVFPEVIEWFDESGKQMVQRIPQEGSGEIKRGAQPTVRESQAAGFSISASSHRSCSSPPSSAPGKDRERGSLIYPSGA